ncbi:MAG: fibrobacter succinogenes major paralogous domain-containing protein [Bacteroidales bacterium]|nr:fibrobacter succinogenes major paralogous domain-containing protein [Bacteroidales bacterium]
MRKFLYSAMILLLAFATSCDKKDDNKPVEPKTWDTSLGTASFATDSTWKIPAANGAPAQEWSDAVQTTNCSSKIEYKGSEWISANLIYNIDCRSNPSQKGDLFSWRAVTEVENLCPEGWRVPDTADFRNLDIALGFKGYYRYQETANGHSWQAQLDKYINDWGGAYGGLCDLDGSLNRQIFAGFYWSQSGGDAHIGARLHFSTDGNINPRRWSYKDEGYTLRCVR